MRRLMLLRHAKTERAGPGERDRDRKLMKRGRDDAALIGKYMSDHGLVPDLAIVSPAVRAQETWALVAAGFAKAPRIAIDGRIYNAVPETLISLIGETRKTPALLVVGHNPGLHELALQLIASAMRKCESGSPKNCRPRALSSSTCRSTTGRRSVRMRAAWSASSVPA